MVKTPLGDFKVITPENPLLSKQVVTSKGISVSYTNLQLNPYPNTQLDLFCSNNLSFSMHGSQYVTNNRCADPSTRLDHQLEKDVGCKVLQFIKTMKVKKLQGHKTLRCTNTAASSREIRTKENSVFGYNLHEQNFALHLCNCATFYGSQNNPYICLEL